MMLEGWTSLRGSRRFLISLSIVVTLVGFGIAAFSDGFQYGLYMDDWTHKHDAFDVESGKWKLNLTLPQPYARPVGLIIVKNLANALPDWELPVRMFWATIHLANVWLAASFAFRIARSPVVLIAGGGVLLFPIVAHEALFWHSGAASALLGVVVALISIHLLLTSVSTERRWKLYAALGLAVYALIPQFYEQPATCVLILPIVVFVDRPVSRRRLRRALLLFLVAAGLLFLHWLFILRHNPRVGTASLSLASLWAERLPATLQSLSLRLSGFYELSVLKSAWLLGIQRALGSSVALFTLVLLAIAAGLLLILALRRSRERMLNHRRVLVLISVGCIWTASAFLPILTTSGYVEFRLLYYPWIGFAFVSSAVVASLMHRLHRRWSYVLALILGLTFAAQIPIVAGVGQVYKLRYAHDLKQLAALSSAVPRLPQDGVILVPIHTDEDFVSSVAPEHAILERFLLGVFETDWSAGASAIMIYRDPGISAETGSRWRESSLQGITGKGADTELLINGRSIPADRSLVFSYEEGQVVLHDHMTVRLPGGREARIELPLAHQVGAPSATMVGARLTMDVELPSSPDVATTQIFGNLISLTGYTLLGYPLPAPQAYEYALLTWWSCRGSIPADYTLYEHYVDDSGEVLGQGDHLLGRDFAGDIVPSSQWSCPGSYLDVSYVRADLVDEEGVDAALGLWIPETGQHLQPSGELRIDQFGRTRLGIHSARPEDSAE